MTFGSYQTEAILLEAVRQGDDKAFYELYKAFYPMIVHMVITNNGSEIEAKDIYQDAMTVVYERLIDKQFELSCSIKTYVYAVSRNMWLKYLTRHKRLQGKIENIEQVPYELKELEYKKEEEEMINTLESALEELGQPCKQILELFYFEKKSMDEISNRSPW